MDHLEYDFNEKFRNYKKNFNPQNTELLKIAIIKYLNEARNTHQLTRRKEYVEDTFIANGKSLDKLAIRLGFDHGESTDLSNNNGREHLKREFPGFAFGVGFKQTKKRKSKKRKTKKRKTKIKKRKSNKKKRKPNKKRNKTKKSKK